MHRNTKECARDSILPSIGELDLSDFYQNVNSRWGNSNLVHDLLLGEPLGSNPHPCLIKLIFVVWGCCFL
jgi:hypothetical protein